MALIQEQMFAVTATIDGVPVQGVFDTFEGGEVDSETSTYRAGGMADAEALPGPVSTSDVTIGRGFRGERDAPLKKWINGKIGREIVIGKQPLNPDKSAIAGALETFRGVVKGVSTPTHDSNGDAVAMFEITATIHGLPS